MKTTTFARKCRRMSRCKKAQIVTNRQTAPFGMISYKLDKSRKMVHGCKMLQVSLEDRVEELGSSRCCSVHADLFLVRQMGEKNMKKLRRLGFQTHVLKPITVEGHQYTRLIKVVRGSTGIASVGKTSLFGCKAHPSRTSRVSPSSPRTLVSCGCEPSAGGLGGGFSPSHGGGGGDGPHNDEEERELLVAILAKDGKTRKMLLEVLEMLDMKEADIRKRINQLDHEGGAKMNINEPLPRMIFHKRIDENQMAAAMYEVYDKMLGNSAKRKNAHYDYKPIELMAYLFMVVALCHYGRYEFKKNGKKPFFEFFMAKVCLELYGKRGVTCRTLNTYVNTLADWFYLTDEEKSKKPAPVQNSKRSLEKQYKIVCRIFHNTKYGKWLAAQEWEDD